MKTTDQLLRLVRAGAHLDLRAGANKTTEQLRSIASAARQAGTTLIIGDDKTTEQLETIVMAGGGCVTVASKE